MNVRGVLVGAVLACSALDGCGSTGGASEGREPLTLPVGPTRVDQFVLGATGAYGMRGSTLMVTSAERATERVEEVASETRTGEQLHRTSDQEPDRGDAVDVLRARQVVTCEKRTLACTPVSPVIPTREQLADRSPAFLVEGDQGQL